MSYYTTLELKGTFKNNENLNKFMSIVQWWDELDHVLYMEKYHGEHNWSKYIIENNFYPELELFLLDYGSQQILNSCIFSISNDYITLNIECDIKNYTDTYAKLYSLLLTFNPVDLLIDERGENMRTSDIYKLQNNQIIKVQPGIYNV